MTCLCLHVDKCTCINKLVSLETITVIYRLSTHGILLADIMKSWCRNYEPFLITFVILIGTDNPTTVSTFCLIVCIKLKLK